MKFLYPVFFIFLSFYTNAQDTKTIKNGNWDDVTTWDGGLIPGNGNSIEINHAINYDLSAVKATGIKYGDMTIKAGTLTLNAGSTWFRQDGKLTIEVGTSLILLGNTVYLLEGDIDMKVNGLIDMTDRTSFFRLSDVNDVEANIEGTILVENGIFAIHSLGGTNKVILKEFSTFTAGDNSAIFLEGNNGEFKIDGNMTMQAGSELVTSFTGTYKMEIDKGQLTYEYGSSHYRGATSSTAQMDKGKPDWEIDLTVGSTGAWRQISSPYGSFNLSDFSSSDFNPSISTGQENIYYWNPVVASIGDDCSGWTKVTSLADAFVAGGQNFSIFTGGENYPFSNGGVIDLDNRRTTYAASYSYTLYNSMDPDPLITPSDEEQGWNFIGNPYPAWFELDSFLLDEMAGEYQGAHMWNASVGQYIGYVVNGESLESGHDNGLTGTPATSNNRIMPFQGFWVKMDPNSGSLTKNVTIHQYHRALGPATASYLKTSEVSSRIRLNIYAQTDSAWDQVLIAINPNSESGWKGNEDAYNRKAANRKPNLSLHHKEGMHLCIDTRPLNEIEVIPMSVTQGEDKEVYYVSLVKDQFDPAMSIFIEDKKTNRVYNLENETLEFERDIYFQQPRFKIHLSPLHIDKEHLNLGNDEWQIWYAKNTVYAKLNTYDLGTNIEIEVFDLGGRLLFKDSEIIDSINWQKNIDTGAHGVQIIRINSTKHPSKFIKMVR